MANYQDPNNPYGDMYASQADVYSNSFANPMNPANMNPGFGMDPNLLTPSYTAGYRPQYSGPQPYNQYGRVGFFAGINNVLNPGADEPRYGNPVDNQRQTVEGVSSRPFDSVVWAGQRVAAPMIAFGAAFKYASGPGAALGRGLGRTFGRGVAAGMGNYMPGIVGRGLTGALGGIGSLAGRFMLPIAVGQMAMEAGQKALFNPYINTRREARDLRDNFSGVTFGDADGNAVTGQGLSYRDSTKIAQGITQRGIKDMTFSTGEMSNIADYSARAGLLDDAKAKQIGQRVKDVAEQIKLVMAIAGDPSIKNAIEQLAQLHNAGASLVGGRSSQASQLLGQIGMSAAVAGRSVQNVMNTVGAQGQYLFQANGMTPYLGQMAAANILGSFEVARRTGTLNTAQIARMGGSEGATQGAMSAMVDGSQSTFNKIALYNEYVGGHRGASTNSSTMNPVNVISQFGIDSSRDPLGTYGMMALVSRAAAGKSLSEKGSMDLENQVTAVLGSLGVSPSGKDGKYSAGQMAGVLKGTFGQSDDQIADYIALRTSESDPAVFAQGVKARNAQAQKQSRQYVSQNYLYGGNLGKSVRGVMEGGRNLTAMIADGIPAALTDGQAWFGDKVQTGVDSIQFGSTFSDSYTAKDMNNTIDQLSPTSASKVSANKSRSPAAPASTSMNLLNSEHDFFSKATLTDIGRMGRKLMNGDTLEGTDSQKLIERINALAQAGSPEARAFINAPTKEERSQALAQVLKVHKDDLADVSGVLGSSGSKASLDNWDNFIGDSLSWGTHKADVSTESGRVSGMMQTYSNVLGENGLSNKDGLLDSVNAIGQVSDLAKKINDGANPEDIKAAINSGKYNMVKNLVGGRNAVDSVKYIEDTYKKSVETGTAQLGSIAYNGDFNVEAFKNNPERIQDPEQQKAFKAAMASNDVATMQNIVAKQLGQANGGKLKTEGLKGATGQTLSDVVGYQQTIDLEGDENAKAYSKIASGRYDFATTQTILNNLDSKKNNDQFKDTVTKLDGAADKLSTAADNMSKGGSTLLGIPSLFAPKPPPSTAGSGQQRNGGSPKSQ